jgi:DNA-binding NarL/FixJ family response regulator
VIEGTTINVAIVEDHTMVAAALASTLEAEEGIRVVATSVGGESLPQELGEVESPIDVVLLDQRLRDGADAIELVPTIRSLAPGARIIVLSAWSDDRSIARAIDAGCDGYLLKEQQVEELVAGVRTAAAGEAVFAPAIVKRVLGRLTPRSAATAPALSARELEVLQLLADGLSTGEIAATLYLSVNTVRNHAQNIMHKLGAHSRLEAVAQGVRSGLISVA